MGAKSTRTGVLIRRGRFGLRNTVTHTQGRRPCGDGAEIGVMHIAAKEHQGVLKAARS